MEITNREKNLLRIMTRFDIARYLMSNAHGRWDGAEKAQRHINLANLFVTWWFELHDVERGGRFEVKTGKYSDSFDSISMIIHDTTRPLTDYLDEVIGFPLESRPDYDKLSPKFFDKFYELATAKLQEISDSIELA